MITNKEFLSNFVKNISDSNNTFENSMNLLNILLKFDPYNMTKFEFSFKIKNSKILKIVRFLNLDCNSYSCMNSKFYLKRLRLFDKIIQDKSNKINLDSNKKVISALKYVSNFPMDLYFGADIEDNNYLFSFWLVFGGVKKDKSVNFWPYNFVDIIKNILKLLEVKEPNIILDNKILNFGIDIIGGKIYYKLYYLCENYSILNSNFNTLANQIDENLTNFNYFYFLSKMYDEKGNLVKEKLFIEFLEDIYYHNENKIKKLLNSFSQVKFIKFDYNELFNFLINSKGKIKKWFIKIKKLIN